MAVGEYERTLEETPTWAVAVVCFVLVLVSIFVEHIIHIIGKVRLPIYLNVPPKVLIVILYGIVFKLVNI